MKLPAVETCIMPAKTVDGTLIQIYGRFLIDFSARNRHKEDGAWKRHLLRHRRLESARIRVVYPVAGIKVEDNYHCRKVISEEKIRAEVVADLKKKYAEVFNSNLGSA
ncbi:unnamed protein product [Cylicostephanus goldi]|uniref:Uncharacterized protein n=1 Tax=Cylicostephanus goldi TaxID=71465 RepID=A0A3P6UH27_CYLGO|nr:unnamed protein product [Cylicostephanus goldi]